MRQRMGLKVSTFSKGQDTSKVEPVPSTSGNAKVYKKPSDQKSESINKVKDLKGNITKITKYMAGNSALSEDNVVLKEFRIYLSRCDEDIDKLHSGIQVSSHSRKSDDVKLKSAAIKELEKKNSKKGIRKSNRNTDIIENGKCENVEIQDSSNVKLNDVGSVTEVKLKSASKGKKLKKHPGKSEQQIHSKIIENGKVEDLEIDDMSDKIGVLSLYSEVKSEPVRRGKKLKKGLDESNKVSNSAKEIENEQARFPNDGMTKENHNSEKIDDVEVCDMSGEKSQMESKIVIKGKRSRNNNIAKSGEKINTVKKTKAMQSKIKLSDCNSMKECQVNLEKCEDFKSFKESGLLGDAKEKVKSAPNKTGKRKRGSEKKDGDNDEDTKPSKSARSEKDSNKSKKSSKEKIPDVDSIDFSNNSKSASGKEWNFKISSWNVNGIRAWLEKNGLSYLHHEKPDIICIQETKCSDDKLPDDVKKIEGYHAYWLSGDKDGYSGVGILSRQEPKKVEYGIGVSEHDNEGRVITAEYEKFYLVAAYVPNAGRKLVRLDYRMKWDKDFRAYLKKLDDKKPVILCGDLNVAHEEIDLANPKTNKRNAGFTQEERDGFSSLLKEGFTDTFRHLYPDVKGAYTFWTYMMNARAKNVGWRLDYFVISERFKENLCDSVIRKDVMGSDHCPVVLFLAI